MIGTRISGVAAPQEKKEHSTNVQAQIKSSIDHYIIYYRNTAAQCFYLNQYISTLQSTRNSTVSFLRTHCFDGQTLFHYIFSATLKYCKKSPLIRDSIISILLNNLFFNIQPKDCDFLLFSPAIQGNVSIPSWKRVLTICSPKVFKAFLKGVLMHTKRHPGSAGMFIANPQIISFIAQIQHINQRYILKMYIEFLFNHFSYDVVEKMLGILAFFPSKTLYDQANFYLTCLISDVAEHMNPNTLEWMEMQQAALIRDQKNAELKQQTLTVAHTTSNRVALKGIPVAHSSAQILDSLLPPTAAMPAETKSAFSEIMSSRQIIEATIQSYIRNSSVDIFLNLFSAYFKASNKSLITYDRFGQMNDTLFHYILSISLGEKIDKKQENEIKINLLKCIFNNLSLDEKDAELSAFLVTTSREQIDGSSLSTWYHVLMTGSIEIFKLFLAEFSEYAKRDPQHAQGLSTDRDIIELIKKNNNTLILEIYIDFLFEHFPFTLVQLVINNLENGSVMHAHANNYLKRLKNLEQTADQQNATAGVSVVQSHMFPPLREPSPFALDSKDALLPSQTQPPPLITPPSKK